MRNSVQSRIASKTGFSASAKARLLMLAVTPVAALLGASNAFAATDNWSGGSGTTANWSDPANWDNVPASGDSVIFSNSVNTSTNNDLAALNLAGVTFNTNAGPFTVGGNALGLTGQLLVNSASTAAQTFNVAINGTAASSLVMGSDQSGGNALAFNANTTFGSMTVSTNSATADSIAVASGFNMNVGNVLLGFSPLPTGAANTTTTLNFTGGGNLNANGTFNLGIGAGTNTPTGRPNVILNLSGLSSFTYNNPTGTFGVGNLVTRATSTLDLASVSNSITAATIVVGDSNQAGGNNGGGNNVLALGNGTNTLAADNINIGFTKALGCITFQSTSSGSLTITGSAGGASTANITVGRGSSATDTTTARTMNLSNHTVNIQANNVIVGLLANATAGTTAGSINFDTGTFNVANLSLGAGTSGTEPNGSTGTFTLGTSAASTGVLNVSSSFIIGNNTGATTVATHGNFIINGGAANLSSDITRVGNTTSNLTTNAGTLNMNGHAIGSAASPITVALANTAGQSATLQSLGGAGINGAGLTAGGAGSLILVGTNSYSGGTTVNSTLQVGSATQAGSLPVGTVANNGDLAFAGAGNNTITTLTGGGTTEINAGSVSVGDASGYSGTITVNTGGNLTGTSTFSSVILAGGNIAPGASTSDVSGTMTITNLTVNSGNFTFNLGNTTATSISAGTAVFNATPTFAFNLVGSPSTGQQFTVLTASTLTDNGFLSTLAPVSVGRTTLTPSESGSSIIVTVSGGPASIVWNGAADGTTWDTRVGASGTQNWLNGASPDYFFANDNVTFNDNNGGHYNVTLSGNLTPGSIKVNSSANYIFSGAGAIVGNTDLTKRGPSTLTLANSAANTYSGGTNIQNGTLVVGAPGALPANSAVSFGDGSGSSGTLDLGGNAVSLSSLTENAGSNVIGSSGASAAGLTFNGGVNSSTFNGVIKNTLGAGSGTVALTVASGNLTLGGANTYSGGTNVTGGTLTLNGSLAGPNINTSGTGVFNIASTASIPAATLLTNNATTNLGNPNTTLATLNGAATGVLNLNGSNLSISTGGTYAGAINDGTAPGTLNVPSGNLTLTGSSNYSGTTTIQSGALLKANHSDSATAPTKTSLGSPSGGNVTIVSGGTLDLGGNTANNTLNFGQKTFLVSGTGTTGAGSIINSGTALEEDAFNNITLQGDTTFSGTRFDIGRNFSGDTLDLANHTLTTNMSGPQPVFALLGNLTAGTTPLHVTSGQIFVNSGGFDIERNASVPDDGSSLITFNTNTVLELFQTDGAGLKRPLVFNGNNTIGSASNGTLATLGSNSTLKGNITLEANISGVPNLTANAPSPSSATSSNPALPPPSPKPAPPSSHSVTPPSPPSTTGPAVPSSRNPPPPSSATPPSPPAPPSPSAPPPPPPLSTSTAPTPPSVPSASAPAPPPPPASSPTSPPLPPAPRSSPSPHSPPAQSPVP